MKNCSSLLINNNNQPISSSALLVLVLVLNAAPEVLVVGLLLHHGLDSISAGLVAVLHVVGIGLDHVVDHSKLSVEVQKLLLESIALGGVVYLVEESEVLEVLDACADVDEFGGKFGVFDVGSLVLVGGLGKVFLDFVQPTPLVAVLVPHVLVLLQPLPQLLLLFLQLVDLPGVVRLQLLQGLSGQPLGLKLLDNLIGVDDSGHFLQLPEGLLVIAEFLPLVILIVLVAGAEDVVRPVVIGAALDP